MENSMQTRNPQVLAPQSSMLGKRKTPPPSTQGSEQDQGSAGGAQTKRGLRPANLGETNLGEVSEDGDHVSWKRLKVETPPIVPKEDLDKFNREVLGYHGPVQSREYYCVLCHTRLNSVLQLERHTVANEHLRRINSLTRDKNKAFKYCEVCHVACASDSIFQYHVAGRKHAKCVESFGVAKQLKITILGSQLEQLLHKDVVAEGNGITLGLSKAMTSFFSLPGPFIGLQYALETGTAHEQNPSYNCTLCNVVSDAHNFHLHFTSLAHRINVLKKDYPEKHQAAMRESDLANTKGDYSAYVKTVAAEIEAMEGRKIELIKRRILRDKSSQSSGRGRGSFNSRGGPSQPKGRGNKRGHGGYQTDYSNESNWTEDNHYEQNFSDFGNQGGGNFSNQGGGNFGNQGGSNFGNQGGGNFGSQRGGYFSDQRGGGNRGRYGQRFQTRGRGRGNPHRGANRGRGGYTQSYNQGSDNWNTGSAQNGYNEGYGSWRGGRRPRARAGVNRGHGNRGGRGFNRGGYSQQNWEEDSSYEQQDWFGNDRGGRGRSGNRGYNRGRPRSSSYSDGGYNSELFGDYNSVETDYSYDQSMEPSTPRQYGGSTFGSPTMTGYGANQASAHGESSYSLTYSSPTQHGHFQMPSPSPMGGGKGWGGPMSSQAPPGPSSAGLHPQSPPVDSATMITNLTKSSIESEEDADAAFKISTALTQALLAYRLKNVAKNTEMNPSGLLSLLNEIQASGNDGKGTNSN